MAEVVPLFGEPKVSAAEQECWDGFWSVLGRAAHRIWQEEGDPAKLDQAAMSKEAA
ncbi:hypothetical protein ACFYP4_02980 [Streptomyces sp. NPDC005551]|uniref:hypothetical protein n=1 Tax=Streptomyces sp. NPDC005551 TaxID=3364725 RepID=UPI00367C4F68